MRQPRIVAHEPRFVECPTCVHFKPSNVGKACRDCDSGENFEEHIPELDPSEDEFMQALRSGRHDD